jgi:hypothetical protein
LSHAEVDESGWSKADEIRWVQWRIRERRSIESGNPNASLWRRRGKYKMVDYKAWLLRQPDGFAELSAGQIVDLLPETVHLQIGVLPLSFQKIGDLLFHDVDDPDNRKKRAADAFNRVESEFKRGSLKKK